MSIFLSIDPAAALMIRLLLAFVFAGAVYHKLVEPSRFRDAVSGYGLLPGPFVTPVAAGLIVLECVIVIAVLLPWTVLVGATLACSLLSLYTASITINLARGRTRIDCGCTGFVEQGQPLTGWLLARNLPLVFVAFLGTLPVQPRTLAGWDFAIVCCAAMASGLLYMSVSYLLVNAPKLRALMMGSGS